MAMNAWSGLGGDPEDLFRASPGFPTNPLHDASDVLLDVGKLELVDIDASLHNHDDIGIVRELFPPKAEGFANQTLDAVAADRRADFAARGDAQSRAPGRARRGVRQKKKEEIPGVVFPAFGVTLREFRAYPELVRGLER
nr:hypothetical protein [Desulfonatronum thiodismutans]